MISGGVLTALIVATAVSQPMLINLILSGEAFTHALQKSYGKNIDNFVEEFSEYLELNA
jgi:hypothetical protein